MSIELHALQRIAVTEESNSNFCIDLTGSATYLDVPFQEGTAQLSLDVDILRPNTVQQRIDAQPRNVIGPRGATLTLTMILAPTGNNSGTSRAITDAALLQLLKIFYGGADASNAGTTFTGGTAAAPTVTSAAGFAAGGACGWADSDGIVHLHEIDSVAGTTINLHQQFPGAPSNGNVARAATTIFLTENPDTSVQMIVEGAEEDDRWLLLGGQLTGAPTFAIPVGGLPTVTFTIGFAYWKGLGDQAITPATYANFDPQHFEGFIRAKLYDFGTARQLLDAAALTWEQQGPIYTGVASPSGTAPQLGGRPVKRWRRNRAVPIARLGLSLPFEGQDYFQERDALNNYHFEVQIGSGSSALLLTMPRTELVNVQRIDQDGLAYQQLSFEATNDGATDDASSEMERSALRIHFMG